MLRCSLLVVAASAGLTHANEIQWGDFMGDTITYFDVITSSVDPLPHFGPPSINGDVLEMPGDATGALASDVAVDFFDGRLSLTIRPNSRALIESIAIEESGEVINIGGDTTASSSTVAFAETADGLVSGVESFEQTGDGVAQWSYSLTLSFPPTSEVFLVLDNQLFAGAFAPGSSAQILKSSIHISVNNNRTGDIAPPFGSRDIFDVLEFLARFDAMDPSADIAAPAGVWDVFDVIEFLAMFAE